ncbi:MAG: hypothetical protein AABY22_23315 [Nanoarchaeota archaeon]|mgnify:CR=1 FL=1
MKTKLDKLTKRQKAGLAGIAGLMLAYYLLFYMNNKWGILVLTISAGLLLLRWKK